VFGDNAGGGALVHGSESAQEKLSGATLAEHLPPKIINAAFTALECGMAGFGQNAGGESGAESAGEGEANLAGSEGAMQGIQANYIEFREVLLKDGGKVVCVVPQDKSQAFEFVWPGSKPLLTEAKRFLGLE
jgi:hypothetical protein